MGIFTKSKAPQAVVSVDKLAADMSAVELRDHIEKLEAELAKYPDQGMEWSGIKYQIREAGDYLALKTTAHLGGTEGQIKAAPKLRKSKKTRENIEEWPGPIAMIHYKAVPVGDGTFNHVSSLDPAAAADYANDEEIEKAFKSLTEWAFSFGINSSTVFGHYGPIKARHKDKPFKEQFAILQEALAHIAKDEKKRGGKVGIFKKTTDVRDDGNVANTETGEVIQQSAAVATETANDNFEDWTIKDDIRERIGYNRKQIEIKSKEDMEYWMRKRMNIVLELQYIMKQFDTVYSELQEDITQFDDDFLGLLKAWALKEHPPKEGAKTAYKGLFGQLSFRNSPMYVKLDEKNESLLRAQLHTIYNNDKELAAKLGIEQKIDYTRDLDKVKPWAVEKGIAEKIGLIVTPPETNKFFIAPSIDTVKRNLREELKEQK